MKRLLFILLFINQICWGQTIKFGNYEFSLSKLNHLNEFHIEKWDTLNTESKIDKIVYCRFSVFASRNCKYFLVVYDTTRGDEIPRITKCFYYKGNQLLWKEKRENTISGACFFESNGSIIVKWNDPFTERFHLFYDSLGKVIDTLNWNNYYHVLENEVLIKRYEKDYLHLSLVNEKAKTLWSDSVVMKNMDIGVFVSGNGQLILLKSQDSLYSYNHYFKLNWKKAFPFANLYPSFSGLYIMADVFKVFENSNRAEHLYYDVYDNKTGLQIRRIADFVINKTVLSPNTVAFIENSDLLIFYEYDSKNKKTYILISNIEGQLIKSKLYNQLIEFPFASIKNNVFELFERDSLIDTFEINYVP